MKCQPLNFMTLWIIFYSLAWSFLDLCIHAGKAVPPQGKKHFSTRYKYLSLFINITVWVCLVKLFTNVSPLFVANVIVANTANIHKHCLFFINTVNLCVYFTKLLINVRRRVYGLADIFINNADVLVNMFFCLLSLSIYVYFMKLLICVGTVFANIHKHCLFCINTANLCVHFTKLLKNVRRRVYCRHLSRRRLYKQCRRPR